MSLTKDDLSAIQNIVVSSINQAIEELVNPRFDELDKRMDKLEGRMDKIEGRMDELDGRMDKLQGRMDMQESAQRETNRRLGSIERKVDDMDGRLIALHNDVIDLYKITDKLKPAVTDKQFAKLSREKKLLALHTETLILAKHFGVKLPQS